MKSKTKQMLLAAALLPLIFSCAFSQGWNVELLGDTTYSPGLWEIAVQGNYAYVTHLYIGLVIFDISNPESPFEVGHYTTPGIAYCVAVSGDYAYVADHYSGLRVINVSDPQSPFEAGYYEFVGAAKHITLSGNYAYMADDWAGLRIINISNPESPFEQGFCATPGSAIGVAVAADLAYVADWDAGLRIIDISNPSIPTEVGHCEIPDHHAINVAIFANYACVTADSGGVRFIDVTNPQSPFEIGYYDTPDYARDVFSIGSNVFVADRVSGIRIINASNPSFPFEIGYYDTPGLATGVVVSETLAYVTDYSCFEIFNCSQALPVSISNHPNIPCEFSLLPAYPNPFNASTVLTYTIPTQSKVTLTIHNLLGQKITTLYNSTQLPGTHTVTWNASNHTSGIYFSQLQYLNLTQTHKILLLK